MSHPQIDGTITEPSKRRPRSIKIEVYDNDGYVVDLYFGEGLPSVRKLHTTRNTMLQDVAGSLGVTIERMTW